MSLPTRAERPLKPSKLKVIHLLFSDQKKFKVAPEVHGGESKRGLKKIKFRDGYPTSLTK